jgi:hypothetical protein
MNAVESKAQPTSERITSGDVQPSVGARVSAKTKRMRPAVTVVAPHASKWRARPGALLSATKRRTKNSAPTPIGTLTKKTHSQPTYSVRIPPSRTPIAAPEPAMAPSTPRALFRSLPSSNVTVVIENTDGERIAAAAPWSMREITSTSADHASPQSSENAEKAARPTMKMTRRPRMSPARPPSSRKPPNVSA